MSGGVAEKKNGEYNLFHLSRNKYIHTYVQNGQFIKIMKRTIKNGQIFW
jgi:hypothetical protein